MINKGCIDVFQSGLKSHIESEITDSYKVHLPKILKFPHLFHWLLYSINIHPLSCVEGKMVWHAIPTATIHVAL